MADEPIISRGFRGRRPGASRAARLPPGQYETHDFPVLSAGPTPHTPLAKWDFTIRGMDGASARWTWDEFNALTARDEPRFWEVNGYHDRGDPWREQRYAGDP